MHRTPKRTMTPASRESPDSASSSSGRLFNLLNEATDSLYIFPVCRDDFAKAQIIGQGFDGELVTDELLTKVI
jgi:hypothetical protein